MTIKNKITTILKRLKKQYPDPKTALNHGNPFELLVATILSAQTTDVHVNKVTEKLFKKHRTLKDYADAPAEDFKKDIASVNFFNNKAKNIQASAKIIMKNFNGKVPNTMDSLTSLPGVARKTANIVLSNAFGINEGIAVDTHVKRLSVKLGLTSHSDPVKIEKDLMAVTPRKEWNNISHLLILHGRQICQAKKPMHDKCVLKDICPSVDS